MRSQLLILLLCTNSIALAEGAFTGTWKTDLKWNGQSYNAKFDGKEYPLTGDPGNTTVVVRKLSERSIEEIDHRGGKVVDRIRYTAARDGKHISVRDEDSRTDRQRRTSW